MQPAPSTAASTPPPTAMSLAILTYLLTYRIYLLTYTLSLESHLPVANP